ATSVLLIGPVNVLRRRRDARHRALGRGWVAAMYLTCVSGMVIYSLNGGFTLFHALAIFTFATTTLGVVNARRGKIRAHAGNMIGGYLGALAAGIFAAAVPARFIPTLFVHEPMVFAAALGAIVVACTAWVLWVFTHVPGGTARHARNDRHPRRPRRPRRVGRAVVPQRFL
ncbi:MAG: DUF2306 domain-containing protein, partial [Micrococcus sp.]|nr:DUF2306 domain-containing protein [Micrococcus sp.]